MMPILLKSVGREARYSRQEDPALVLGGATVLPQP
jgi:hypothetical protein